MAFVEDRPTQPTSTLVDRVSRVDLRVRDIDRSLEFYRDVVGLEVAQRSDRSAALRSPESDPILALSSDGVTGSADPGAAGLYHVAIRFPNRAALGDALARLIAADYRIGAGDHGVSEALYIDDPDGNGVELYRDRPIEQWPPPSNGALVGMTTGPVDMEAVLDAGAGRDAVGRSAVPGTDIGHVHLQVADIERTVTFYSEALGLDLTQRFGGQAAFLSSNGYHHHVGANTWNSRGSSPTASENAGLDRIVFAVRDADQLEHVRLRLGEYGHETDGEAGRFLIVRDPDSIELHFILD